MEPSAQWIVIFSVCRTAQTITKRIGVSISKHYNSNVNNRKLKVWQVVDAMTYKVSIFAVAPSVDATGTGGSPVFHQISGSNCLIINVIMIIDAEERRTVHRGTKWYMITSVGDWYP
ncbi:hypothetical protein BKA70DRAFT_1218535 [Coprinopsis sp. MPI-PUGE-AT-0042]|nr:hypothetical protein BKA70DRAFT_1218535 [Coprinopsis sp. MPI-PUGE-AT-0042]